MVGSIKSNAQTLQITDRPTADAPQNKLVLRNKNRALQAAAQPQEQQPKTSPFSQAVVKAPNFTVKIDNRSAGPQAAINQPATVVELPDDDSSSGALVPAGKKQTSAESSPFAQALVPKPKISGDLLPSSGKQVATVETKPNQLVQADARPHPMNEPAIVVELPDDEPVSGKPAQIEAPVSQSPFAQAVAPEPKLSTDSQLIATRPNHVAALAQPSTSTPIASATVQNPTSEPTVTVEIPDDSSIHTEVMPLGRIEPQSSQSPFAQAQAMIVAPKISVASSETTIEQLDDAPKPTPEGRLIEAAPSQNSQANQSSAATADHDTGAASGKVAGDTSQTQEGGDDPTDPADPDKPLDLNEVQAAVKHASEQGLAQQMLMNNEMQMHQQNLMAAQRREEAESEGVRKRLNVEEQAETSRTADTFKLLDETARTLREAAGA
ncbi:hypothetical protein [Epibacterium ulvae]|uniref:hypothetical protein n=1 Tax=Epibacterium ulvae TaxID=1156985 RepID=UPI0024913E18|nr:hypothetical protein [Epibacterium ulvae]